MTEQQQQEQTRDAINLLRMVAPERSTEVEALLHTYAPSFFEATDRQRFVLEANPLGFVLYSNRTLLQVWLLGWVMWKEMYCWSTFIWELATERRPFVLAGFTEIPGQEESYADADALYARAVDFARSEPIDWTRWPSAVPRPLDIALHGNEDRLINDLVHHAVAFFLLHELRHLMLRQDQRNFPDPRQEEFECDRWATEYLLARSDEYAQSSGEDPTKVRSKRAMGVALGTAVIAHIQEVGLWKPGTEHPPIADRMQRLVEAVDLPGNDYLWNVACSFLLATLRRQQALPAHVDFNDQRELFTKLLSEDRLRHVHQ